jgi:hypothetical protein
MNDVYMQQGIKPAASEMQLSLYVSERIILLQGRKTRVQSHVYND